jgi:predicted Fe-S protein YdhL (DUF1289 family)
MVHAISSEPSMPPIETGLKSPCNRVCVAHPALGLCIGCGRTLDEIARWAGLSDAERGEITARLPARLAAAGIAVPVPA